MLRLRDDAVAWREVDGEVLLLDLATSTYLATNPTATLLWQRLAAGTTVEQLVAALVDGFGIDGATARTDVDDFLADCRRRSLLLDDDD